jgi:ABC-type transport system involved in multi-copper enzyme maturation permease subunit
MTSATATRPAVTSARDGFGQLLRAEWTKLRSVRSTAWCLLLGAGLMVLISMLAVTGSTTTANQGGPLIADTFHFVHQPLDGDGSITARVITQQRTGPAARAGIMIKSDTEQRSPYASIAITPERGVLMQADFAPDVAGSVTTTPVWLRLTRAGSSVTAYESTDGATWSEVGRASVADLSRTAEVGLFVTSPSTALRIVREGGNTSSEPAFEPSVATFGDVTVAPASANPSQEWSDTDVGQPGPQVDGTPASGSSSESNGVFTVTGAGDIGTLPPGGDNDIVRDSLTGVLVGMIAIIVLGVVFITSEYAKGVIRTTFTASPRRGRVLAAKAVILGGTVFVTGLVAALGALYTTRPIQRRNGFEAPAYPDPSLTDGPVLRAIVGTGLFLAVLALFALGVGTVLRRAAGAITVVIALVIVPSIIGAFLPLSVEMWLNRATPLAGLALQQTRERYDSAIDPWTGFGVLCAWAAVALAVALWQLRRRDA